MPAAKKPSLRKKVFFSGVVVVAFCVCLESAARIIEIWLPTETIDYGQGFDDASRIFSADKNRSELFRTRPGKRRVFHDQTFLVPKPLGTLRIVTLGGSSINNLQLEWKKLKQQLQKRLAPHFSNVEIINAGGRSYGSHRLVKVMQEMLSYEPDLVLVYSGHNEFEEVEQLHLSELNRVELNRTLSRFSLFRLLRDRWTDRQVSRLAREHRDRVLADANVNVARAWRYPFTAADVTKRMSAFRENLTRIIQLCQRCNVPVIIGSVPSNLVKPYLPRESRERFNEVVQFYQAQQFEDGLSLARNILRETIGRHQSSDLENEIIRQLSKQYNVPLADVERNIIAQEPHGWPGATLFSDHCHFNQRGNEICRQTFEKVVMKTSKTFLEESDKASQTHCKIDAVARMSSVVCK